MQVTQTNLGIFYIILGVLLFVLAAGMWLIRVAMLLAAIYFINHGLCLYGINDLKIMIIRYFDKTRRYY